MKDFPDFRRPRAWPAVLLASPGGLHGNHVNTFANMEFWAVEDLGILLRPTMSLTHMAVVSCMVLSQASPQLMYSCCCKVNSVNSNWHFWVLGFDFHFHHFGRFSISVFNGLPVVRCFLISWSVCRPLRSCCCCWCTLALPASDDSQGRTVTRADPGVEGDNGWVRFFLVDSSSLKIARKTELGERSCFWIVLMVSERWLCHCVRESKRRSRGGELWNHHHCNHHRHHCHQHQSKTAF